MENFNHLNSTQSFSRPMGLKKTKQNVEGQSTFMAVLVLIVFTIIAAIVC